MSLPCRAESLVRRRPARNTRRVPHLRPVTSIELPIDDPFAFALEIGWDGLEPGFCAGSRVVISPRLGFKHGALHYVEDIRGRSYVKRVSLLAPDRYLLQPLNPSYPSIELAAAEIRYIWRVVMVLPA